MRLPQDRILHIDTELAGDEVRVVAEWQGELVRCKDCKYAFLFDADDERDGLCGHPSNNAWDIFDEFYCGRGVKHELVE